ncbi:MAG: sulfatase [Planctomycetota bacterium]
MYRLLITSTFVWAAAFGCGFAESRPNIIFIMSDDHAAQAVGAYGGRLASLDPTPAIDRLAADGTLFTNCFATNSICTPSRASILTGQYSHANGVLTLEDRLPVERQHLPRLLADAGYETAIIGKWHLDVEPAAFGHYEVLKKQGLYFNPIFRTRGPRPWPGNTRNTVGHSTDVITGMTIKWLRSRKKDRPFFLMHHLKAPHDNFENAERYDWLYEDEVIPEPPGLRERGSHGPNGRPLYGTSVGKRNSRRNMGDHMFVDESLTDDEYLTVAYQRYLKKYLRCVRGVDDNVGKLIDYLRTSGLIDNTVIVYTSDQGMMLGEHDYIDKRWMYEESMRMPLLVRLPGGPRGTVSDALVSNVDFAQTILALAGVEAPRFMQGRDLTSKIRDGKPDGGNQAAVYYRYWMHMRYHDNPAHLGIRTANEKLIFFYGLPLGAAGAVDTPTEPYWEYYDLESDPHEMKNAIDDPSYRSRIEEMHRLLLEEQGRVGDVMPPNYAPPFAS